MGLDGELPTTTHLVAKNHADSTELDNYERNPGECCFCATEMMGVPAGEAISKKYFTDNDLVVAQTAHVCACCAYCMDTRELKQGHWIATKSEYRSISTGDLQEELTRVQHGRVDLPVAVHISADPIRSEHAYLWTPVSETVSPLVVDYDRQRVRISWPVYEQTLAAVEELRWHGFRGEDIRSGEPRVSDIEEIGRDRYIKLDSIIDEARGTPLLDLIWTVSHAKSDQETAPKA